MNEAELARWLVLYQGVVGTGIRLDNEEFKGTNSKGDGSMTSAEWLCGKEPL